MKNIGVVITILIVLILIYVAYNYFFKKKNDSQSMNNTTIPQSIVNNPKSLQTLTNVAELNTTQQNTSNKLSDVAITNDAQIKNAKEDNLTQQQTQQIVQKTTNSNAVDCNSLAYRQKLSILGINVKQLEIKYSIAVFNLSKYDISENRQEVEQLYSKLEKAKSDYVEFYNLCNNK